MEYDLCKYTDFLLRLLVIWFNGGKCPAAHARIMASIRNYFSMVCFEQAEVDHLGTLITVGLNALAEVHSILALLCILSNRME